MNLFARDAAAFEAVTAPSAIFAVVTALSCSWVVPTLFGGGILFHNSIDIHDTS
jgi:hypothetical protein